MAIWASRTAIVPNNSAPPSPPIAAIAFKTGGFEDFDPGQPGTDAERGAAECTQQQTQQDQQRNLHGGLPLVDNPQFPKIGSRLTR